MILSSKSRSSGPARSRATWCIPICAAARARRKSIYPKPELEKVLGKTLGVPLFQEQAMRVAIACAGFTASEADQLRRSMATFKHTGGVSKFRDKLVDGMVANGYERDYRRENLQAIGGFRQLRISGKPRGLVRADRLCLLLAQMPSSGCLLRGALERAADGILRAGPDRA